MIAVDSSKLSPEVKDLLLQLPLLDLTEGYWERTGLLRAQVISRGRKARLADALIAQSCIDYSVALITRDNDFRNFVRSGLKLV